MRKKSIAFLFGAGAEGKGNHNLPMGAEYLSTSMFNQNIEEVTKTLGGFFDSESYFERFVGGKYKYRANTLSDSNTKKAVLRNFLQARCRKDINFFRTYSNFIKSILGKDRFDTLLDELSLEQNERNKYKSEKGYEYEKNEINKAANNLIEVFKDNSYKPITSQDVHNSKKNKFFNELYAKAKKNCYNSQTEGVAGILDSKFHTIINPRKFGIANFSKIFNYYWVCYFAVLEPVIACLKKSYQLLGDERFVKIHDNNLNNKNFYNDVIKNIVSITQELYSKDIKRNHDAGETYYSCIATELEKYKEKFELSGIITTNYYRFCEIELNQAINNGKNEVAYLNGSLNLFEYPELLVVEDFSCGENRETVHTDGSSLFFPFIFGQSLVKPIVHPLQIDQFGKMNNILEQTDTLIVLGYNINQDDNHVNSYIRDFIIKGNNVFVVSGSGDKAKESKKALKLEEDNPRLQVIPVEYGNNAKVVGDIFKKLSEL